MSVVENGLLFVVDEERRFGRSARDLVRNGADKEQKEQQLGHTSKLLR
jgi:hypothetical protein